MILGVHASRSISTDPGPPGKPNSSKFLGLSLLIAVGGYDRHRKYSYNLEIARLLRLVLHHRTRKIDFRPEFSLLCPKIKNQSEYLGKNLG